MMTKGENDLSKASFRSLAGVAASDYIFERSFTPLVFLNEVDLTARLSKPQIFLKFLQKINFD